MNKKYLSLLVALSIPLSASAKNCSFHSLKNEINIENNQQFSQYFDKESIEKFRRAKYREFNFITAMQEEMNKFESMDERSGWENVFYVIMSTTMIRVIQNHTIDYSNLSYSDLTPFYEEFKSSIKQLESVSDEQFFDSYLTSDYRKKSYYYDIFKEIINELPEQIESDQDGQCKVNVDITQTFEEQMQSFEVSINPESGKVNGNNIFSALFDYKGAVYLETPLPDDKDGVDFSLIDGSELIDL